MKKVLSLVLAMAMMLSNIPVMHAQEQPKPKHWASEFIQMAIESGILPKSSQNSAADFEFHPDEDITRAQFITFINRAFGFKSAENSTSTSFLDIRSHSAKAQIEIAYAVGYINGFSKNQFAPDSPLTREQALVMMYRIFKKSNPEITKDESNSVKLEKVFKDADKISDWAKESVSFFVKKEIIKGLPDGSFAPKSNLSGAQSLAILVPSKKVKESIEIEYREIQEKKAQEEKKTEKQKKNSQNSSSKSSSHNSSDSSNSSENSDSTPKEDENQYLYIKKISNHLYLVKINQNEALERAREEFLKKYKDVEATGLYFAKIFKDDAKMLVFSENHIFNAKQISNHEIKELGVLDGIYTSGEGNLLKLHDFNTDNISIHDFTLAVGNAELQKPYEVGKFFIGFPNNKVNFGIILTKDSKRVDGVNFHLENTQKEALHRFSTIAQKGSIGKDNPENLKITNNTFHFGTSQIEKRFGVAINIPVKSGELLIDNNHFFGSGEKNIESPWAHGTAISLNSRALPDTRVKISNNEIKDFPYNGIDITIGADSSLEISKNILSNIGQNGITVSVFKGIRELLIHYNEVDSYGTRMIKRGAFGAPQKEINADEVGISLKYIEDVYGVKVNSKYYNEKSKLVEDLSLHDNKVATKVQNDTIDGVLDCTPTEVGQSTRFHNPIDVLNSSQRIAKDSDFIVVKSTDGDLTLGFDPQNPDKKRMVKNLLLVGNGSGRITLSSNLQISGDLTIDLPNCTIKNQAEVSGKTQIINSRGEDNSSFSIMLNKSQIHKMSASEGEIIASISNITTQSGEKISAQQSILKDHIDIYNGSTKLNHSDFSIDDEKDTITFSHIYLNKLQKSAKFSIEYQDASKKINSVKKFFDLELLDFSSAKIEFAQGSTQQIVQKFAPNEGIKIQITQIKDILGKPVDAKTSNLSNLEIFYIYDNKAQKTQFSIEEETDVITLSKELLDKLPTPISTDKHDIRLVFSDERNHIGRIELRLGIKVLNYSGNAGEVTTIGIMTFTQGKAPKKGISFQISGMKKADGSPLSPSETSLTDYLTIMPFPTNWKFEIEGMGENVRFKKSLYEIDEENDIITFKEDYLNKLDPKSPFFTDRGIKQFQLTYNDPRFASFFVSKKAFIHIKSKLQELNNSTKITSVKYNISENKVASGDIAITENTSVLELLQNLERDNARQTLRVYAQKYNDNGNVNAQNIYRYKNDEEHLKSGDFLLVTAEDGKSVKLYAISLQGEITASLITQVDDAIVSNVDKAYISLARANVKVSELKDAIRVVDEAQKSVISGAPDDILVVNPDDDDSVNAEMKFIIQKDDKKEVYAIRVFTPVEYRALIIANSDYPGNGSDLEGPANDLKLMNKTFAAQRFDGTSFKSIKSVSNATKTVFLEEVKKAFQDADDNDISYLYYSGHGNNVQGISYICTVDEATSQEHALERWVSVSELKELLDEVKGKKVIILDSCNSGGFIGKPAVDAVTSPTPQPATSSKSTEFLDDVVSEFTAVRALDHSKPNYLVGNNYKVLAASSENEYSYEDKLNKVGKFTKALSEGAGIEGKLLADADQNGEVSLEEMYQYTEDNVVYTSHVQAYPRNDSFRIFANPVVAQLSGNLNISAKNNAYNILDNGKNFMISSKNVEITTNMSVETFLSHIEKADPAQELYVVAGTNITAENAKQKSDKMAKLDKLLVVAENGESKSFIISVKTPKKPNNRVNISSKYHGMNKLLNINTTSNPKEIKGSEHNSITASTKVSEFKNFILKGYSKQELYVIPKDAELEKQNAKGDEEALAQGDRLLVYAESQKKDFYLIILSDGSNQTPPSVPSDEEADNLNISSVTGAYNFPKLQIIKNPLGKKIAGTPTNPLNTSTKVAQFLEMIVKGNVNQELYVIAKGQELSKKNKKADDMTLATGDRLLVYSQSQKIDSYEIIVMLAQDTAINFGDAFEIQNAIPKYKIIGKSVKINNQMSVKTFLSHIQNKEDMESIFINDEDYLRKGEEDLLKKGDILLVRFKGIPMPYSYSIVVENTQSENQDNQTNNPSEGSEGGEITIPVPPTPVPPVIITPPENTESSNTSSGSEHSDGSGHSQDSNDSGTSENSGNSDNSSNSQEGDISITVPPAITPPQDNISVPSIEITQP